MNKLQKFAQLSLHSKVLFAQAWFMLGWYRGLTRWVSFKRLAANMEHHERPVDQLELEGNEREEAKRIGSLVAAASRATPWDSPCLAQVLVVQSLLARRNIPGQLFLGVRKESTPGKDRKNLFAHAWVLCGKDIVNGGSGVEAFTAVSVFTWGSSRA